jgi:hypothetical protein
MVEQLVADAVGTPEPVEAHENSKSPRLAVSSALRDRRPTSGSRQSPVCPTAVAKSARWFASHQFLPSPPEPDRHHASRRRHPDPAEPLDLGCTLVKREAIIR